VPDVRPRHLGEDPGLLGPVASSLERVKLHRCRFEWLKTGLSWRVEKALKEMGVDYGLAPGPSRPSKRDEMMKHTGQRLYPAIEFEDGKRGTAKS